MPPSLVPVRVGLAEAGDDDAALLLRVAAGERSALEALYRAYHRRLGRFLGRLTRRPHVIEEVINDTFLIVWRKAEQFRGDSRASTWIMGIAYRAMLKVLRVHGDEPLESDPADRCHPTSDPTAAHELSDWLQKGLGRLPLEQRMTMELAYCAGHSMEEIAAIMECQVSTVKARMFHARVKLRNLLPVLAGGEVDGRSGTTRHEASRPEIIRMRADRARECDDGESR